MLRGGQLMVEEGISERDWMRAKFQERLAHGPTRHDGVARSVALAALARRNSFLRCARKRVEATRRVKRDFEVFSARTTFQQSDRHR